jgi:hypothetical protein
MNTSDIFNRLLCDDTVQVALDANGYNTLRVAMLRKFKTINEQYLSVGINAYEDSYMQCTYESATGIATFKITPNKERKRRNIQYTVL